VQWFREEFGGRMGVKASLEIVTEKKMKDGKLAKGCLKVRFWASETRKQSKLLILYQKPPGYRPPDSKHPTPKLPIQPKLPLLIQILHPQRVIRRHLLLSQLPQATDLQNGPQPQLHQRLPRLLHHLQLVRTRITPQHIIRPQPILTKTQPYHRFPLNRHGL
jgi:hypothetical protein